MPFPTIGAAGTAATAGATAAGAAGALSSTQEDKDLFLQLMVTQLRNQDPMSPMDSADFLAQTAQFTSLEKLELVVDQTAQALSAQMAFGASSLVGQTVTYLNAEGVETSGAVSSVRFTPDGPMLKIEDTDVRMNDLVGVGGDATS